MVLFGALAGEGLIFATPKRPQIALLGITIATSSVVFEGGLPLIPIGIGSLHIPDGILLALLGLIILRWLNDGFESHCCWGANAYLTD